MVVHPEDEPPVEDERDHNRDRVGGDQAGQVSVWHVGEEGEVEQGEQGVADDGVGAADEQEPKLLVGEQASEVLAEVLRHRSARPVNASPLPRVL